MMQRHIGSSADLTPAKLLEVLRHRPVAGALPPPIADMEGLPAPTARFQT